MSMALYTLGNVARRATFLGHKPCRPGKDAPCYSRVNGLSAVNVFDSTFPEEEVHMRSDVH